MWKEPFYAAHSTAFTHHYKQPITITIPHPPFPAVPLEHVRIIDEINFGNGLPEMRTWKQAEDAGKAVGFKLVTRWVSKHSKPTTLRLCDMSP
jgi:hypothetical protein